ncbi:MAG TPA: hypothetical protein VGO11_10215 [Chthoniobacteraceae bacterium]|jgi:hypothetical protein|nr:hypothetical protein [Chthoniobacteraceae bacterium]
MFIVWGTKRTIRKQGYIADFCPLCREVRAFELLRIGLASHLYYVSFGQGRLAGHLQRCLECRFEMPVDPGHYASIGDRQAVKDLEQLILLTNPQLRQNLADRLATEARLRHSPASLTPEMREALLLESFKLVNPEVEMRYKQETQLDKPAGLGCFGTIILSALLFYGASLVPTPTQEQALLGAAIFCGLGIVYTFVQIGLAPRRWLRARIVPLLAGALEPLQPTREELQSCLQRCEIAGLKIGRKLKLPVLWAEMQRRGAS